MLFNRGVGCGGVGGGHGLGAWVGGSGHSMI